MPNSKSPPPMSVEEVRIESIDHLMDALIKAARKGIVAQIQDARSDLGVFMMNQLRTADSHLLDTGDEDRV